MGLGVLDTPTDDWECFQWVNWHKHLVKTYRDAGYTEEQAKQYAKSIFLTWWDKINTFWGSLNWCGYGSEFFNYFKSVGVTEHLSILAKVSAPIISATTNVAESAGNILTDAGKIGENASSAAGDVTKGAGNTAKVLKVLLPVTLVALAGGAAYYAYKHFLKGDEKIKLPTTPADHTLSTEVTRKIEAPKKGRSKTKSKPTTS